jgi:diguanylate cyclase (GGDEF)-like protein
LRYPSVRPSGAPAVRSISPWYIEFNKPGVRHIDLYIPRDGTSKHVTGPGRWEVRKTGMDRPLHSRDVRFRSYVLALPVSFSEQDYFYIRIDTIMSMNMLVTLHSPRGLAERMAMDNLGFGVIYGILLAMILYNLVLLGFLRDRIYAYYVLHMASVLADFLIGYGHVGAFLSMPVALHETVLWVAVGNAWFWATAFSRVFLGTRQRTPRIDRALRLFGLLSLVMIAAGLLQFGWLTNIINNVISPIGSAAAIAVSIVHIRKGFRPAWYYLIGWSVFLVGIALYAAGGVLLERNFITVYTLAIGSAVQAVLLSLAMVERVKALQEQKEALERNERRLTELSIRDSLTSLYNRRYLEKTLSGEIEAARTLKSPLSVLVLDVDHFKEFNDIYGHLEGDKVLIGLGRIMQRCSRKGDRPCRYGGEEFVLVLPGAALKEAYTVAERIRFMFSRKPFAYDNGRPVYVTVSIGVASLEKGESAEELVRRADEAMYQAKASGRNRVHRDIPLPG